MPTLYEHEIERYGFGLNYTISNIQLHPKGINNEVWLELQHSFYTQIFGYSRETTKLKYFKLISHRNQEYTQKFKGRNVSKEWVIGYCKHNHKNAYYRIKEHVEEEKLKHKQRKEMQEARQFQKKQAEKALQHAEANALEIYKNKEKITGYRSGAEICPRCRGDALRHCHYCEGTGWISFA